MSLIARGMTSTLMITRGLGRFVELYEQAKRFCLKLARRQRFALKR